MRLTAPMVFDFFLPGFVRHAAGALTSTASRLLARARLSRHDKLHLACGDHLMPGWANVDLEGPPAVIRLDLTKRLPVGDGRIGFVYSEHFIEHIALHHAQRLVREIHRVLRPGGVFRLSTPNLQLLLDHYAEGRIDFWRDMNWHPETPCRFLNESMRLWGHQFVYDRQELETLLRDAGFATIRQVAWQSSEFTPLKNVECRPLHGELIYECIK